MSLLNELWIVSMNENVKSVPMFTVTGPMWLKQTEYSVNEGKRGHLHGEMGEVSSFTHCICNINFTPSTLEHAVNILVICEHNT